MGFLRVYVGGKLVEQRVLDRDRFTIGRSRDNDLVLSNPSVSTHHATIVREAGRFFIEDSGSTNGVFFGNERISRKELEYWDELQIVNYVLKFMAVTHADEGADPDIPSNMPVEDDRTRFVNLASKTRRDKLRKQKRKAFVVVRESDGSKSELPFEEDGFRIGRGRDCDLRTGGWIFAPKLSALIEKESDGYHLVPHRGGKVTLNGQAIESAQLLKDGDEFTVRGLSLRFAHRIVE